MHFTKCFENKMLLKSSLEEGWQCSLLVMLVKSRSKTGTVTFKLCQVFEVMAYSL